MKLRRLELIVTLALGLLVAPLAAEAQQAGKVTRIGMLCATRCEGPGLDQLREGLRDLGWIEGSNLVIETRGAGGQLDRLPMISETRSFADTGGLMTYGASVADLVRRSAIHVDKILKGAKPADLPVEQPTKFELVVNLKTAKALGLTIPPSLLLRADQVIQ